MRITSGQYKNRKLFVPEGINIRPTSDRMRQSLFNMLHHSKWARDVGFEFDGARVLDLYCGSGALGLESLSHGASHCIFVDRDIKTITQNASFLNDDAFKIIKASLPKSTAFADMTNNQHHLIFLDPPYNKGLAAPTIHNLIDQNILADNAIIIAEVEKGLKLDREVPLKVLDHKTQSMSDLFVFGL